MVDESDGFVSRWSRRKAAVNERRRGRALPNLPDEDDAADQPEAATAAPVSEAVAQPSVADPRTLPTDAKAERPADAADPEAELPPIDSLTEESDFSAFLRAGVPEELQRLALRKLWRLNPVFGHLDGLNDYDEDYTMIGTVAREIATAFQPGKGMPSRRTEDVESGEAVDPTEPESTDAAGDEDVARAEPATSPETGPLQEVATEQDDVGEGEDENT